MMVPWPKSAKTDKDRYVDISVKIPGLLKDCAPSTIATGGDGFGGQIGFEVTDFVFILNSASDVKTFS